MIKNCKLILLIFCLSKYIGHTQTVHSASKVFTDFNTYYESNFNTHTTGSHHLIGFEWNNIIFSTVVNDSILIANNPTKTIKNQVFKNLPTEALAEPNYGVDLQARNNIGLGVMKDDFSSYTGYKQSDFRKYMSDGINGLDIGTGVFNINLKNGNVKFENITINPASIGDGIPDILLTQIGAPPSSPTTFDKYYFTDKANQPIGSTYTVAFTSIPVIYNTLFYFYRLTFINNNTEVNNNAEITYNPSTVNDEKTRPVRLVAFDWSEVGINTTNYTSVSNFFQIFSGDSDTAFIAYNQSSLKFIRTIGGKVTAVDKGTLQESAFPNAEITIYRVDANNIEHQIGQTTTNSNGFYQFQNVESNNANEFYRVKIMNFDSYNPKYFIVNNKNGKTTDYLDTVLEGINSSDNDFTLGKFCVGDWIKDNTNPPISPIILGSTGITTHANPKSNWLENVPNSQLTLDSKSRGFVVTRIDPSTIPTNELVEGMLIYDIIENCLKLYDGNNWDCLVRDCYQQVFDQTKPRYPSL